MKDEDKEIAKETKLFFMKALDMSENTAEVFAYKSIELFNIAEELNELSDFETAKKIDNIRKTLISSFTCWLLGVDIREYYETVADFTCGYVDCVKDYCVDGKPIPDMLKEEDEDE